ncbi:hypothetical protein CFK37_09600 [Virgibacillus phasianinus]|uniref:Uncharacterized protein n=1 Tax=Virgibacillus phasianinus TaxID=2017483 RepID=A0A220U335_9BACI|nr:hypothetical protein CFK37_09600 [Virgibacillus phasianinus]
MGESAGQRDRSTFPAESVEISKTSIPIRSCGASFFVEIGFAFFGARREEHYSGIFVQMKIALLWKLSSLLKSLHISFVTNLT